MFLIVIASKRCQIIGFFSIGQFLHTIENQYEIINRNRELKLEGLKKVKIHKYFLIETYRFKHPLDNQLFIIYDSPF